MSPLLPALMGEMLGVSGREGEVKREGEVEGEGWV